MAIFIYALALEMRRRISFESLRWNDAICISIFALCQSFPMYLIVLLPTHDVRTHVVAKLIYTKLQSSSSAFSFIYWAILDKETSRLLESHCLIVFHMFPTVFCPCTFPVIFKSTFLFKAKTFVLVSFILPFFFIQRQMLKNFRCLWSILG